MRVVLLLLLSVMSISARPLMAQAPDTDVVLARVGDREITARDFLERYEATPWLGREDAARDERNRIEFLASMVAELLLAIDAERQGVEWHPEVSRTVAEIQRLNVLDALYREEVIEPVEISEEEIDQALADYLTPVAFAYVQFSDSTRAGDVYRAVRHGVPFDSVAVAHDQSAQFEVRRWSEMVPEVEEAIYAEAVPGRIIRPVEVDDAWYVIRIEETGRGLPEGMDGIAAAREAVRRTMQWRREQGRLNKFLSAFSDDKNVVVHGERFQELARAFREAVLTKHTLLQQSGEEVYPLALGGADFSAIRRQLQQDLGEAAVSGPDFKMSLDYVLDRVAFKGFKLDGPEEDVSVRLSQLLQKLIHEEFLAREAFARGLEQRADVRREVERWQRAHLAYSLMKQMAVSRPAGAERQVWEVKIQEVLVEDAATADSLLMAVMNGADLSQVARTHSQRDGAAKTDGISGYFETDGRGELGLAASIVEVGSLFGPIQLDEGYSFFRLLDRRAPRGLDPSAGESVAMRINRHIARLASETPVDVDLEALSKVQVSHINKVIYRYMGFGNRMPAAPSLMKMVGWLDFMDASERPFAL